MHKTASASKRIPSSFAYGYGESPYALDPGPHLFIDWRYIDPGRIRWHTPDGAETPLWAYDEVPKVRGTANCVPYGLKLAAQHAKKTGPLILPDRDWEFMLFYCCMLDLGGRYGLWYEAVPPRGNGSKSFLCYAESEDGVNWTKPELGIHEFAGNNRNNIVISPEQCPYGRYHGSSVFIDRQAPPDERFKAVYWTSGLTDDALAALKERRPESVDAFGEAKRCAVMMATSSDGVHWKMWDDLLFSHVCDTQTVVEYDELLERYVCYTRSFQIGRRSICRTETSNIREWPSPEMILWTPPDSDPADDLYLNSKSLYPGTRTMHLMFPTMYERRTDSCALRLATSLDNYAWQWLPEEVMQTGTQGEWDGGCFLTGVGLTEIPGDRVALPYVGYAYPHKYPRFGKMGAIGMAVWQKERLVALEADEDAEFWTNTLAVNGDRLFLNFDTKRAGFVKVEVEGANGRSLGDCDPLFDNELKKQVTWKGSGSLGIEPGKPVRLHFQMRCARLFSFEVR